MVQNLIKLRYNHSSCDVNTTCVVDRLYWDALLWSWGRCTSPMQTTHQYLYITEDNSALSDLALLLVPIVIIWYNEETSKIKKKDINLGSGTQQFCIMGERNQKKKNSSRNAWLNAHCGLWIECIE